ncbi:bifunctional DNA primase/polymerase [Bradyrhizobium diazoefficiens]|uniref:bifunctional DNA primase/polymerase n=1 Tax=Bradyrhizobium diazoefficiens TaxID=1355477 RepID=UPI0015B54EA2|nr:bifunctional DNA primase/polymerase [Bradyrhizobium diazoefficiens]QLD40519.1 bifunctional DNA primase/polymerase [Bradyrhizobium diazoefficiens]
MGATYKMPRSVRAPRGQDEVGNEPDDFRADAGATQAPTARPHCLDAAQEYARFGWTVFPGDLTDPKHKKSHKAGRFSRSGKRWGATRDSKQIARDFKKWPDVVCIPCGVDNNVFVLDADTKAGGHEFDGIGNLQALIDANGPLDTRMAQSPSGSLHYYFEYPEHGSVRDKTNIVPGVDIRGEGGHVVAPPSLKPGGGEYKWLNRKGIARAPQWLLDLVLDKEDDGARSPGDPSAPLDKIAEALDLLSNDARSEWQIILADGVIKEYRGWDGWNSLALAIFAATGGSDAGFKLFDKWCRKNTTKYNEKYTHFSWYTRYVRNPPTKGIGARTLFAVVDDEHPGWEAIWNEEHGEEDDDELDAAFARVRQTYEGA